MRQIVVDTETTGLDLEEGNRIVEIACLEMNDRKLTGSRFHEFVNPQRTIDADALKVHGIDNSFLDSKPVFPEIAQALYEFISGSELIIHNAAFDLRFLNHEFSLVSKEYSKIEDVCEIVDTLEIARQSRPGRRNSLDALANQFGVDLVNERTLHGALLDARILAQVYVELTGGQTSFSFRDVDPHATGQLSDSQTKRGSKPIEVVVQRASKQELEQHESWLDFLDKKSEDGSIWRKLVQAEQTE